MASVDEHFNNHASNKILLLVFAKRIVILDHLRVVCFVFFTSPKKLMVTDVARPKITVLLFNRAVNEP